MAGSGVEWAGGGECGITSGHYLHLLLCSLDLQHGEITHTAGVIQFVGTLGQLNSYVIETLQWYNKVLLTPFMFD